MPPTACAPGLRVHCRWMIRRDLPEVLAIEHASSDRPRGEDEILAVLRNRNCIGMVAEHGERVVGFMIYELHRTRVRALAFAVHPGARRRGVGSQLAAKLVAKLSSRRRTAVGAVVPETAMGALLFARRVGFLAVGLLRGHFADDEDGIEMEYALPPTPEEDRR